MSKTESSKLGLNNFAGVFVILASLLIIAAVVLIIEMLIGAYADSVHHKVSPCLCDFLLWCAFDVCCVDLRVLVQPA